MSDYAGAQWIPTTHFDAGRGSARAKWFVFHGTGYSLSQTAADVAHDFATTNPNSTHYAIGRAADVAQMVREADTAWGNGPVTAGAEPWFLGLSDANPWTISAETVNDSGNAQPLAAAQQRAAFALCVDVCRRNGIPLKPGDADGGIVGHKDIDPVNRAFCPGPHFPWQALWDYIRSLAMPYLAPGAEAISEFARQSSGVYLHATCVEAAALMCLIAQDPAAAMPGAQIGDYLQSMVSVWESYGDGVTSQGASSYVDATRWLRNMGATVDEDVIGPGWWDELVTGIGQDHNVYLVGVTNAQGLPGDEPGVQNHGLCAYGYDGAGGIICGDPDNARAQVNMPSNPVGLSVTYSQQDFINGAISSLTRVHPMSRIPAGWTDDGTTLTAPPPAQQGTGVAMVRGFRDAVLNPASVGLPVWNPADQPLAPEAPIASGPLLEGNGTDGPGSIIICRYTVLCWTAGRGVFRAWPGSAILADRAAIQAAGTPAPAPAPAPDPKAAADEAAIAQIKQLVASL